MLKYGKFVKARIKKYDLFSQKNQPKFIFGIDIDDGVFSRNNSEPVKHFLVKAPISKILKKKNRMAKTEILTPNLIKRVLDETNFLFMKLKLEQLRRIKKKFWTNIKI
ncbi:MAG: hypothetical protein J7J15_00665 [Candidatus Aenigmarchaeota archaeon]|nr:hypothetical protein [Candidatus Aenigmarchaeota archaeon]